jgi:tetratricopeptide (TPR) repeat protein
MLGRVYRTCGDLATARRLHEEMLSITRELGTALWTSEAFTNLGEDLLAVGDDEEGRRLLDEAVTTAGEALRFSTAPLLARAALWLRLGRPGEALETARRLRSSFSEPSVFVLPARRLEGEALIALGQAEKGERALRDAKNDALAVDCISEQWRIGLALDRLLAGQGRRTEAEAERARARALLERVAADLPAELARQFAATEAMRHARQEPIDG